MCYGQRELSERRLGASFLEPSRILVGERGNDHFVGGKASQGVLDRLDRVGVTDLGQRPAGASANGAASFRASCAALNKRSPSGKTPADSTASLSPAIHLSMETLSDDRKPALREPSGGSAEPPSSQVRGGGSPPMLAASPGLQPQTRQPCSTAERAKLSAAL